MNTIVWRWILVIPAFLAGTLLVPVLFHLAWELGFLVIPFADFLSFVVELLKSGLGGFCGVWLAKTAAPSHKGAIGIGTAILTVAILGYLSLLGGDNFSTFEKWNYVVMGITAILSIRFPAYDEL